MTYDQAVSRLKDTGQAITPQRMAILKFLIKNGKPLTARQVYKKVKEMHPNISLDTVYRNLTMLTHSGIISQVNLLSKESSKFEFQSHHHHHAVCLVCGKIVCLDDSKQLEDMHMRSEAEDFEVTAHAFEIYGVCNKCKGN